MVTVARSQGARWRRWGQVALAAYWSATGLSDLVSSSPTGPDGWVRLLFGLAWAVLAVLSWRERVELSAGGVRVVGSFRSRSASWDEVSGVRRHQDWQDVLVLRLSDGRELEVPRHGPELEAELRAAGRRRDPCVTGTPRRPARSTATVVRPCRWGWPGRPAARGGRGLLPRRSGPARGHALCRSRRLRRRRAGRAGHGCAPGVHGHPARTAPSPHVEDLLVLYLGDGGVVADVLARVGVAPVVQREPLLGPGRCTVEDPEGFRVVLVAASWDG